MVSYILLFLRYIIQRLIKSWSFGLFVAFSICSFVSVVYQTKYNSEDTINKYVLFTLLANISFSYIAGYIFYVVSDFARNIKAEFDALVAIAYAECEILSKKPYVDLNIFGKVNIDSNEITCNSEPPEVDYETEYKIFRFSFCERNPYEKLNHEKLKLLANLKINDSYVSYSKDTLRNCISYFDLLTGPLSRFLSYEEILSIAKLKSFYNLDFAKFEEGKLCARQFEIDSAFEEYFDSRRTITRCLRDRATFCVLELKQSIMELETFTEEKDF